MKLPAAVYSALGPILVVTDDEMATADDDPTFGAFCKQKRTITIDADSAPEAQLSTLMHECVHVAMWDAGTDNVITEIQAEAVCDAVGTYLAAAILAGYLKLGHR